MYSHCFVAMLCAFVKAPFTRLRSHHDWLDVANDMIVKLCGLLGHYFPLHSYCTLCINHDSMEQVPTWKWRRKLCRYQFHNWRTILESFCAYCECFRGLGVWCGITKLFVFLIYTQIRMAVFWKHCIVITWVFQSWNELPTEHMTYAENR